MASLMVPTTPVSRRALEATPSKKVSLEAVGIRELYLNLSPRLQPFFRPYPWTRRQSLLKNQLSLMTLVTVLRQTLRLKQMTSMSRIFVNVLSVISISQRVR